MQLGEIFSVGDLLRINVAGGGVYYYHISGTEMVFPSIKLLLQRSMFNTSTLGQAGFDLDKVEIIRSGRANLLNEMAAHYVLYQSEFNPANFSSSVPALLQSYCDLLNPLIGLVSNSTTPNTSNNYYSLSQPFNVSICNLTAPLTVVVTKNFTTNTDLVNIFINDKTCVFSLKRGDMLEVVRYLGGWKIVSSGETECNNYPLSCLNCTGTTNQNLQVVSSSANEYSCDWIGKTMDMDPLLVNSNKFETGELGKWKVSKNYIYKTNIKSINPNASSSGNTSVSRLQDGSGTYTLSPFKWTESTHLNWILSNEVKKYSTNGSPVEQVNIMNVYSSAHYGFNKTLPILVASDSKYNSSLFEHFEINKNNYFESGINCVLANISTNAHSGKKGYILPASSSSFQFNIESYKEGVDIKFWVKSNGNTKQLKANILSYDAQNNQVATVTIDFGKVASSGEWELYQTSYKYIGTAVSNIRVTIQNNTNQPEIIDDLIVKPIGASTNSFVYDVNSSRLLTSFDNSNFGTFYQYNGEGKLVRKIVETKKGKKTVQNSGANTPLIERF